MSYHQPVTPELTPQALAGWLRTQDPEAGYTYQDPAMCLLGFYFRAHDADEGIAEATYERMPEYREIAEVKPHTFGAALERTEKLLALPAPTEETLPNVVTNEDQKEPLLVEAHVENQSQR